MAVSPKAIILQVQQAPETECFKPCYLKLLDPLIMWLQNPACHGLCWGHSPTPMVHTPQKEAQGGFVFSCQGAFLEAVCWVPCAVAVKTMNYYQLWLSSWITQAPQCINCVCVCLSSSACCMLFLTRSLSDSLSSFTCLQFSATAPVGGETVCSLHSLKKTQMEFLKLQCRHITEVLAAPLLCIPPVRSTLFTDVQNWCFGVNTKLALVWNADCIGNTRWCHLKPVL